MESLRTLANMRRHFETGVTRTYEYRKSQLKKLREGILSHEEELYTALYNDLKKSKEEVWATEIGLVLAELNSAIKNLRDWMRPERVKTNLVNLPSRSYIMKEALGVVLIISPWNYPFQLLINPLIGALAAGNCVMLKASEFAPATAAVIKSIVQKNFSPEDVALIEGDGATVIPGVMNNFSFDHVFYTGSTAVGRVIYKMAADRLVPVTLELGGKSPCVVEEDANVTVAARRIAMTKFSNAGQMCVAPDYLLVHNKVKDKLVIELQKAIAQFFVPSADKSENYGKIINEKQFDRIQQYISQGRVIEGGSSDRATLFIAPTLITDVKADATVMKDEIFGPVLPIIPFNTKEEALAVIRQHPNPLAFYIYSSNNATQTTWLEDVPAGGACVNNSSWHLTNHHLPFGGRGFSGAGNYHGKFTFETFSHKKAVMKTPTWFDPNIKYPPFKGKLKLFKKLIR